MIAPDGMRSALRFETLHGLKAEHGRRLVQFGVVGVSGVLVNMAVLFLLVQFGHMQHLLAAAISSEISILTNFALNDRWTFADGRTGCSWWLRGAQYNAVALSGMTLSLLVLAMLTVFAGMHYLTANLLAMGAATLSNYALNTKFTWASGSRAAQVRMVPIPVEVVAD